MLSWPQGRLVRLARMPEKHKREAEHGSIEREEKQNSRCPQRLSRAGGAARSTPG